MATMDYFYPRNPFLTGFYNWLYPYSAPMRPLPPIYGCQCLICRGESALKRNLDQRESPTKELPTKYSKFCRVKERQAGPLGELAAPLGGPLSVPLPLPLGGPLVIGEVGLEDPDGHSKKCAGTQTAFSSFPTDQYAASHLPEGYPRPGDDGFPMGAPPRSPSHPATAGIGLGGPHRPLVGAAASPAHLNQHQEEADSSSMPLNLTVSSASHQYHHHMHAASAPYRPHHHNNTSPHPLHNHHQQQQNHHLHHHHQHHRSQQLQQPPVSPPHDVPTQHGRPSVITRATTNVFDPRAPSAGLDPRHSPPYTATPSSPEGQSAAMRREPLPVESGDPDIEEHFRRSLGRNYPDYIARSNHSPPPMSTSPAIAAAPSASRLEQLQANLPQENGGVDGEGEGQNVSVTGSVDDHFAKSLGDTWTKIKAQKEAIDLDLFTGTVDDHFAKALGDTWLRIKAQKEPGSSPAQSMSGSPSPISVGGPSPSPASHHMSAAVHL